jgi:hypothetical protein
MVPALVLAIVCTDADAATFLVMTAIHGMGAEANPLVVALAGTHGLLPVVALRLILVTEAAVVIATAGAAHRTTARLLLLAIATVGAFGAVSNVLSW